MGFANVENKTKFIDENGSAYGIKHVGNKPRTSSMPYPYDIAEGNIDAHDFFRSLGSNADVDAAKEDLWEKGGTYAFPAAGGVQMEVISTGDNAADDDGSPVGSGIRTVMVHYLDADYAEQTETLTMNGVAAVATQATDILRVQHFHAVTVGAGGVCAGSTGIDLRHVDNTPIYGHIANSETTGLTSVWTVPASKTAYITGWDGDAGGGNKYARFMLCATSSLAGVLNAGVFQCKDLKIAESGGFSKAFILPIKVPAQADIKISVISAGTNAECTGSFSGWYET